MAQKTTDITSILALGRLFQFTSNKRFHLLTNDFILDNIGKKALELNNEIKEFTGINIFEARDENDLLEYQNILNNYTTRITNENFSVEDVADEVKLIEQQSSFSKDRWRSFSIEIPEKYKPFLKEIPVTIPELLKHFKNPDYIVVLEETKVFLTTKKVTVKNKERILFAFFSPSGENNLSFDFATIFSNFNPDIIHEKLQLNFVFLVKYNDHSQMFFNPLRLFIYLLNRYSLLLTINNTSKRIFINYVLPAHIRHPKQIPELIKIASTNHLRFVHYNCLMKPSSIAFTISVLFALDEGKYLDDFNYGKV